MLFSPKFQLVLNVRVNAIFYLKILNQNIKNDEVSLRHDCTTKLCHLTQGIEEGVTKSIKMPKVPLDVNVISAHSSS